VVRQYSFKKGVPQGFGPGAPILFSYQKGLENGEGLLLCCLTGNITDMIAWEREERSGISKEVSDQYAIAPFMPGATMVPSAAPGDFGGQLGDHDPEEPFVQIIDPYEVGGGQVLDLRASYAKRKAQRPDGVTPSSQSATEQLLALGRLQMQEQPEIPDVPQMPFPQPMAAVPGQGTSHIPQRVPTPTAAPPQQVAPMGQPAAIMTQGSGLGSFDMGGVPPAALAGMQDGAVHAAAPMDTVPSSALPPMQHIPAPPPMTPAPQTPQAPPPTQPLEVRFHMPDGSQYVCYYHAVIRPEGQPTLILVTDMRGGQPVQRFIPPPSIKGQPIGVAIAAHNLVVRAYSIGIQFAYDGREYTVLVVDQGQESYGENGTAGGGGFSV